MKKALSIALVLVLALSLFAGCKGKETPLTDAVAYLEGMYQTGEKGEVMPIDADKDVVASVAIDGVSYPVEWSINITEGAADSVKIGESSTENCVMIDLPDVAETDILFSAIATVKDEEGNSEAATFNYKMACTLGDLDILDKAYALADGEKLSGTPSLTGDIVEVKTPYDATAKNITVVIQVGDAADKLIQCVGLQGDYVDGLVVGDNICVTGVLGKNGGIVGFESGCTLVYVNKADGSTPGTTTGVIGGESTTLGDGTTTGNGGGNNVTGGNTTTKPTTTTLKVVTDQAKILKDAFALGRNETTPYIAQLTGKVIAFDKRDEYGNVTLTISVGGKNIICYKMKGNGADKVKVNDTITVKGVIKNFFYDEDDKSGDVEFTWDEASGTEVTLVKLVAGQAETKLTNPKDIVNAAFALPQGGELSYEYELTGEVVSIGVYDSSQKLITVDIKVEGKIIKCYKMSGNGLTSIKDGDKITVKGKIKNFNGTVEFDYGCQMTKRVAGTNNSASLKMVDSPKAGVAYKFGMIQGNVDKDKVYYITGKKDGYYMGTATNSAAAVDVYLENTSGGFYLYAMVDGAKKYINMVVNGTHVNGEYESSAKTVYTYDATAKTIVATVNDAPYWFGTRNDKNYTTVGPCKTEYEGFYCHFYA